MMQDNDSLLAVDIPSDPIEDESSTIGVNEFFTTDLCYKSDKHRFKAKRDGDDHFIFALPPNRSLRPSDPFAACIGDGFDKLELRKLLPRRTKPTTRASKSVFGSLALTSSLPKHDYSSFKHKEVKFDQSHAHLHESPSIATRQLEPAQNTSCITEVSLAAQPIGRNTSAKDTVAMQLMSLTAPQREWNDSDDGSESASNVETDFESESFENHDNGSRTSQTDRICITREMTLPSYKDDRLLDDIECSDNIHQTDQNVGLGDEPMYTRPGEFPQEPHIRQWNEISDEIDEVDASADSQRRSAAVIKSEIASSMAE